MDARSPKSLGGTPTSFLIYLQDVDKAVDRALKVGGKPVLPVKHQFRSDSTKAMRGHGPWIACMDYRGFVSLRGSRCRGCRRA